MGTQVFDLYSDLQIQSAPTSRTFYTSDSSIPTENSDAAYKYTKIDSPCFDPKTFNGVVTIRPSAGVPVEHQLASTDGRAAPCDANDDTMPPVASHRLDMTSSSTTSSVAVEHSRCITNSAETVLSSLDSADENIPVNTCTDYCGASTGASTRNGSVTRIRAHVPSMASFSFHAESCISDL